MKKLITLLLVLTGAVCTASAAYDAYNSGYLALHFNKDGGDWAYLTFDKKGVNPDNSSQMIYEYVLNSSTGLDNNSDVYFRLKYEYYGEDVKPYTNDGVTFVFNEGVDNREGGQYGTYNINSNPWYGNESWFRILHTNIKAHEYKITVYAKIHDDGAYKNDNEFYLKVEIVDMPVTIGSDGYATFSCDRALDFTGKGIQAYIADDISTTGKVGMSSITKTPANQGLFLKGTEGTVNVPVITTDAAEEVTTNYLKPTTGENIYDSSKYQYVFAKQNGELGFYKLTGDLAPDAGKAYLEHTAALASGARVMLFFDDEVTAVEGVKAISSYDNVYYNLAGQRVAQPLKGLYIVNGKKVIMK